MHAVVESQVLLRTEILLKAENEPHMPSGILRADHQYDTQYCRESLGAIGEMRLELLKDY